MRISSLLRPLILTVPFLFSLSAGAHPLPAAVDVIVSVRIAPPPLPVYTQPLCRGAGYIWTPGYWAYGPNGYFWVSGAWILPPRVGLLWTPGYWGFSNGLYVWNAGYWGPTVGFYGGINYGFGYSGTGFYGGYWRGNQYFYNTRVTNVNRTIVHNVYSRNVAGSHSGRVSYNGGPHGVNARPTSAQLVAAREHRASRPSSTIQREQTASANRTTPASMNHHRYYAAAQPRAHELNSQRESSHKTNTIPIDGRTGRPTSERHAVPTSGKAKPEPARTEKASRHEPGETHSQNSTSSQNHREPAARPTVNSQEHKSRPRESKAPTPASKPLAHPGAPKPTSHNSVASHTAAKPQDEHRVSSGSHQRSATHQQPVHSAEKQETHPANRP
jgi:hypothetical protein